MSEAKAQAAASNEWSREKMIEESQRRTEVVKALRARLPRRDLTRFEEEMQGFGPTMLFVVAENAAVKSSDGTEALMKDLELGVSLHFLPTLFEDWMAKDYALKITLAALLGFENIPDGPQGDYWSTFAGEDITDLIALALGHRPMADDEDAPDLLRRVFVWGQDEDPIAALDDEGRPVEKAKPCKQTLPLSFEEDEVPK